MKDIVKGYLCAFISAFTYGLIPLFMIPIKKEESFSVDATLFYRFLIASGAIVFFLFYQKERLHISFREMLIMSLLGLLYALSAEFLFLAYDYLSPGIASTIFFSYPIIVALVLILFYKEKLTIPTLLSLLLVVVGVGVLSIKKGEALNYIGLGISLLGALVYALYILIVNKVRIESSGVKISFYSMLFSSLYFLVKSLLLRESISISSWALAGDLTLFAIITTSLSLVTLVYAVRYIGSTPTAIMGAFEPIVAVLISVGLFGEQLTPSLVIGGMVIITGVLIDILFRKHPK
ncbi:EamA family transporter [Capnocytophaga gingivalis]|jgi:putative membrane protein|uniref:EamA family transporter n=1 Tax=Capnocytophaga gingivalis TaxID=1017 RepID=A0A250FQN0_9FLAO|nr:DMT family transporter [Capnocytophaga gingivalis]ATA86326.1 EamA family transporter [Capnocytophaga gingivalis]